MSEEWGYEVLKKTLLENKELYVDKSFPASPKSITYDGELPKDYPVSEIVWKRPKDIVADALFVTSSVSRSDLDQGFLGDCWFVAAAAILANGPTDKFEKCVPLDQGFTDEEYAGIFRFNFWDYGIWKEVVIDDLLHADGENLIFWIFCFNFWDYGIWKEVVIDDLLPTDGENLIFCQNRVEKNEFWGALFEKAYAKFKGNNYEAIVGGKLGTALVDFTGGLSEIIQLSNPKIEVPSNLYQLLQKNRAMDSLLGACIHHEEEVYGRETRLPNGLFQGHAYSITGITENSVSATASHMAHDGTILRTMPSSLTNSWSTGTISQTANTQACNSNDSVDDKIVLISSVVQLLRLRNPHGENEWNGPWSDGSREMKSLSADILDQLKQVQADDGEFWMSFQDFVKNFDEVCLCHLIPNSFSLDPKSTYKHWQVAEYHDAWINGLTAGGCGNPPYQNLFWKNPQFQIHLIDPDTLDGINLCTLIVSLVEKEKQIDMNEVTIGFDIFEIRDKQNQPLSGETLPQSALKYVARSGAYQGYREVVRRFELKPGYYVIIPSTFYPYKEAKFLIRIYTETAIHSEVLDESNVPSLASAEPDPIMDLFKKHAGDDGRMDHKELQTFLEEATGNNLMEAIIFQEETCRSLLILMDRDRSGFLNMVEAKHAYKEITAYVAVFRQFDKDKSNSVDMLELGTMFKKLVVFVSRQKKVTGPDDVAVFTRNEFLEHTMFC